MRPEIAKQIPNHESKLLAMGPSLVFYVIALADGVISERERIVACSGSALPPAPHRKEGGGARG